jgi:hypothetical protein
MLKNFANRPIVTNENSQGRPSTSVSTKVETGEGVEPMKKKAIPIAVAGREAIAIYDRLTEKQRDEFYKQQEEDQKRYAAEQEDKLRLAPLASSTTKKKGIPIAVAGREAMAIYERLTEEQRDEFYKQQEGDQKRYAPQQRKDK